MAATSGSDTLPTVLLLGGLGQGFASACLAYLWGTDDGVKRASHVRLCDKFLLVPQNNVFLRYVEPSARTALTEGYGKGVEYVQTNLIVAEARQKAFVPPKETGKLAYDLVIDFLHGDTSTAEDSDDVMIENLANLVRLCGLEALKNGGVGCYLSLIDPYITQPKKQCPMKESDANWKPTNRWSVWVHEGARSLAAMKDLNLVVVRLPNPWGPGTPIGFNRRLTLAAVYKYMNDGTKMEFLWGKDLVCEHLHLHDMSSALYAIAQWMLVTAKTRSKAEELAAAPLPPCRPIATQGGSPSDSGTIRKWDTAEVPNLVKREETVCAPMFYVSDGSASTQGELGKVLEQVIGIKIDYHNAITNALAKLNMLEVVDIAEEKHSEPWLEMLSKSNPPITSTPLNALLTEVALRKHRCHFDITKTTSLTGWRPRYPRITVAEVQRTIDIFKADNVWPTVPPRQKK